MDRFDYEGVLAATAVGILFIVSVLVLVLIHYGLIVDSSIASQITINWNRLDWRAVMVLSVSFSLITALLLNVYWIEVD